MANRLEVLKHQLDTAWGMFTARIAGLSDEEFLWEPVPGCWSVHPPAEHDGLWRMDWGYPEPDPPPFTTIGWRINHIAMWQTVRWSFLFGSKEFSFESFPYAGSAEAGQALVEEAFARYRGGLDSLGDGDLDRVGHEMPYGVDDRSLHALLGWMNLEFIHHAAEVALLRDLYRATGEKQ